MIQGNVIDFQARVEVTFRLTNLPDVTIEFVVDTGFEGALTLPIAAVESLGLPLVEEIGANLADDSVTMVNFHAATILWDGELLGVAVLAMGKRPLLGTSLLKNKHLGVDFVESGRLTLSAL